jgi:hypothetical protein
MPTTQFRLMLFRDHSLLSRLETAAWSDCWFVHRFFITTGNKFGADYLAYEEDPELCHSTFAVKVVPGGLVDEFDLGASCRAATGARKRLLIADPVEEEGHWIVNYTTVAFERAVYFQAS